MLLAKSDGLSAAYLKARPRRLKERLEYDEAWLDLAARAAADPNERKTLQAVARDIREAIIAVTTVLEWQQ
jgi:hypothetical protein